MVCDDRLIEWDAPPRRSAPSIVDDRILTSCAVVCARMDGWWTLAAGNPHGTSVSSRKEELADGLGVLTPKPVDGQAERLRGLEVDNQFERSGLLDGQVGGPGALENLVDVASGTSLHLGSIYSIGHEAAWLNKDPELIDCRDPMRGRKIDDGLSMQEHEGRRRH